MIEIEYTTTSLKRTHKLGYHIGQSLKPGDVLALCGELGAGKTSLSQGISRGLGVDLKVPVTSPTFAIVNEYEGRIPVYHLDLYRIRSNAEFYYTGLEEFFCDWAVTVVEWADKYSEIIPDHAVWINMEFINYSTRKLRITYEEKYHDKNRFSFAAI